MSEQSTSQPRQAMVYVSGAYADLIGVSGAWADRVPWPQLLGKKNLRWVNRGRNKGQAYTIWKGTKLRVERRMIKNKPASKDGYLVFDVVGRYHAA